jgi:hypothetical protein
LQLRTCSIAQQKDKPGVESQDAEDQMISISSAWNIAKESPMLRITSNENGGTVRLKLEGTLKGTWVPEMERCWRSTTSEGNKALIVDLTDVEFVDTAGRYLLALMHAHGASFVAATPLMSELVAEISAQPDHPH